jgi:hypothetical protein
MKQYSVHKRMTTVLVLVLTMYAVRLTGLVH